MESLKQRLTLVKAKTAHPIFSWHSCEQKYESKLVLYDNKVDPFNLTLPEEACEDPLLLNVASLNEALTGLENGICIEFLMAYENITEKILKCSTRVTLDDAVVKVVANLLNQPKLSVEATTLAKAGSVIFDTDILLDKTYQLCVDSASQSFTRNQLDEAFYDMEHTFHIVLQVGDIVKTKNKHNVLQKLFTNRTLADCCIVTASNTEISCHGCILATNSDVFHTMLRTGFQESQTRRIEMSDVSDVVVNALLSHLYGLEIDTSNVDMVYKLLMVAHKYNIESLEGDMLNVLLRKPNMYFDMDSAVGLYFFTMNIENFSKLCEKIVNILRSNTKTLASSATYQELLQTNPKEAAMLALKLLEL